MQNFDSAFKKVCELVDDFKKNEQLYLSPKYSEAQVRQDFIDKFFESLGWDIYHKIQKNPYEQEVRVEKGVSVEKSHKRADYAFFISPEFRQPKFFAEAKKPSRSLKNAQDYFQTIRYAWSANTPVALLTDFEELHILDCRLKPNINQVLQNACHKSYKYTDYLDIEKYREIYFLFSRDSVADGSLVKYSESLPKLKGKKVAKSVYQSIDDDFLEYIDKIREDLAKAFKKNDASLTSEELTEATQRTIDRLVFIRFLEDKQIEPDFIVSEFVKKENPFKSFISVCRTLDAKYNGIVFKKHFIDEQNFHGPEQSIFKKICDEISNENSPYDFNAIPIHILGSIYERFLGKVVNATAQRVKVEEKPEVRKAGGVYYTPKYIVDYIVENTVGKILYGETNPGVTKLELGNVNSGNAEHELSSPNVECSSTKSRLVGTLGRDPALTHVTKLQLGNANSKTPAQISSLRFADIACGSGSFLIGVFETLLKYHTEYYQLHPDQAKKDGCIYKDGQWVLSIKQKQKILLNNIYGVDIDQQAVEVTQLSLALKMLEDETTATANEMQALFHEKILPDLSKNIVCGNSLIGTDILAGKMFASDEERKLNPMDFETTFPEVFKNGGFDAIVGNPPYINIKLQDVELKEYISKKYQYSRSADLYVAFLERGLKILKEKARLSFIVPNKFFGADYGKKFRDYVRNNFLIENIYDLKDVKVFKEALISCICITFIKQKLSLPTLIYKDDKKAFLDNIFDSQGKIQIESNNDEKLLISKIESHDKLNKFANIRTGIMGFEYWKMKPIIKKNGEISDKVRKLYTNGNFNRYIDNWSEPIKLYKDEYIKPTIKLDKNYINSNTIDLFKISNKILVRGVAQKVSAIIDFIGSGLLVAVHSIIPIKFDKFYILGILNSKLINWFHLKTIYSIRIPEGSLKYPVSFFYNLPIPNINTKNESEKHSHDLIVSLVDQMLTAKKQLNESKTDRDKDYYERRCTDLDRQIDAEVYKLYGLTEEEIKIVEGKE